LSALRPDQVLKILELTDSFNLHRESVFIPLGTEENGSATLLPDGRLRIVCPRNIALQNWLEELRALLEKMDLSKVRH